MVLSYPIDEMKADLKAKLSSHRHGHTESVLKTAMHYANQLKDKYEISDEEISKLEIAALLHDICKELHGDELLKLAKHYGIKIYTEDEASPNVLHARVGAAFVEDKYEIYDPMILDTIREHTLGSRHMTTISKILYLADYIEPLRDKDDKEKNPEA